MTVNERTIVAPETVASATSTESARVAAAELDSWSGRNQITTAAVHARQTATEVPSQPDFEREGKLGLPCSPLDLRRN